MSRSTILVLLTVALLATAGQTFAQTVPARQDEPKLIAVLQDPDASHKDKTVACRQLSYIGGEASVAPLAALLGDEKLAHMARYALEPNPAAAVDIAFRKALATLKGKRLVGVIGSIGVRRDAAAVGTLTRLLRDSDPLVAGAAGRALGSIGNEEATKALRKALPGTSGQVKRDLCEGLFRCGERLCANGRPKEAIAVYDQMRKLDGPHQVRGGAQKHAILARGENDLSLLRESLRSDDYILFSAAVQAAQTMSDRDVTEALIDALDEIPPDNQIVVIRTLGLRGDRTALRALSQAARRGRGTVRIAAMASLTEIGDPATVPVLARLVDDSDRQISQAARDNLAAFPGKEADAAVLSAFQDDEADKQLMALELMGRRRMTGSIRTLMETARRGDASVRPPAIKMIGELGGADVLPALLDLLTDLERSQEMAAAEQALVAVCTKSDDPQAQAGKLIGRLGQTNSSQKSVLIRVLGAVGGPRALQAVRSAAGSEDAQVRSAAARALSTWKTGDAAPHLMALAKSTNDPAQKLLFLRGYINLAGRDDLSIKQRLAMCTEAAGMIERNEEKRLLLGTLSKIESPEGMSLIVSHLDDAGTRQEAALAAVTLAEKLLKRRDAGRHAGALIEPLEKVTQANVSDRSKQRAKALLGQAKSKAGR